MYIYLNCQEENCAFFEFVICDCSIVIEHMRSFWFEAGRSFFPTDASITHSCVGLFWWQRVRNIMYILSQIEMQSSKRFSSIQGRFHLTAFDLMTERPCHCQGFSFPSLQYSFQNDLPSLDSIFVPCLLRCKI